MKQSYILYGLLLLFLTGCEYPFASGGTPIPIISNYNPSPVLTDNYDVTVTNLSDEQLDLWFECPKGNFDFTLPPNGVKVFGGEYLVQKNTYYSVGGDGYATEIKFVQ